MRRKAVLVLFIAFLFTGQATAPEPALTPNQGTAGSTLEITVSTPLPANGQVRFEPAGLLAFNLRNDARRQLMFTLQIPPTARPGRYDFVYTAPVDTRAGAGPETRARRAFTVLEPPRPAAPELPAVRTITPDHEAAGAPPFTATIIGARFASGAKLEMAGVQVLGTSVSRDGTTLTAQLSIPPNAKPGTTPVIVTNRDGGTNRGGRSAEVLFRILSAPTPVVRRVDPASALAGTQGLPVVIAGSSFAAGAKVGVSDGSVVFGGVNVVGGSQINATIFIAASVSPGPRAIVVTNPDGRSNAAQTTPVLFTVLPLPPPAGGTPPPPKSTGPPTITLPGPPASPPPVSKPPLSGPPAAPPPAGAPPVATPPGGTPPVGGPPASTPPVGGPPVGTPPVGGPPASTPPGGIPPFVPAPPAKTPPTERLIGPRIDLITPNEFTPGSSRAVQLVGKNLTPGMTLAFTSGVVVTKLRVNTPTSALATIDVGPAVKVGTYPAHVTSNSGTGNGPGGILVKAGGPQPSTATPVQPAQPVLPTYDQPTGNILLDKPCDVNAEALMGGFVGPPSCADVPMLTDEASFFWHEENPGIAKFFVFEILDYDGTVLFSAQTKQTWYRLSAANLATLPRVVVPGAVHASGASTVARQEPATPGYKPAASGPTQSAAQPAAGPSATASNASGAQHGQQDIPLAPNLIKDGATRSEKAGHHPLIGEVLWRVRGMSNKLHEHLGTPLPEMLESERSVERPLLLPLPPNGFSCDSGTGNSKIAFLPRYSPPVPPQLSLPPGQAPDKYWPPRPKPCELMSTNICSGVDLVEFTNDSHINLTRIPFDLQQSGTFGGPFVRFDNVWIDWGDGSEPEPLEIKGNLAKYPSQSLKSVRFFLPAAVEDRRVAHRYKNEDKEAAAVDYTVRIYALADSDASPPHQVAGQASTWAQSTGSVFQAVHGEAQSNSGAASASTAQNASSPHTSGAQNASPAQTSGAAMAVASGIFTIACQTVRVHNVWEVGFDDPLHLLTASIVFSTEMQGPPEKKTTKPSGGAASGAKTSAAVLPKETALPPSSKTASKSAPPPGTVSPQYGTGYQGGDPTIPEVSDCSTVFKAAAKITYYGHGSIALDWFLDDWLIEQTVITGELDRVSLPDGEAGTKPYYAWMTSALPPALSAAPHRVRVVVRVVVPSKKKKQQETAQKPYGVGPTQTPAKGKKKNVIDPGDGPNGETFSEDPQEDESWKTAESPVRKYFVFNHKDRGLPCTLRYQTADTGAFEITDITSFVRDASGGQATFSGNGQLNVPLPSNTGSSTAPQGIPIQFDSWTLEPAGEDYFDVTAGTYEKTLKLSLEALHFPFRVTKISMTPQRVALSGDVAAGDNKGFTTKSSQPALWEFQDTPITSEGDFYYETAKKIDALLGASGFEMTISSAAIDFSITEGEAPVKACTPTAAAEKWQGVAISGTLLPPDALRLNDVPLLKNYKFEKWGIAPNGLSVAFTDDQYTLSLSQSGVKVTVRGLTFAFCEGDLGKTQFGLDIENAPLIVQKISGTLTMDDQAQLLPKFEMTQPVEHNWGKVRAKITDAQFVMNPYASAYGLSIKSHVWFVALGKPAYDHAYDGLFITLAGSVVNAENKHYWGVPNAGMANLGGFPMTVTQLGVGNEPNGDLWFGFTGDIEAGENAPQAPNKEAKFVLTKQSSSALLRSREPWQLASLDLIASESLDLDEGYTTSDDSLQVESFQLNWAFPPGSGTVKLEAECMWGTAPNRYFMYGKGKVIVLDSFTAGAEVLFGRIESDSYWVLKGHYQMATMIPLGSTPFGLARFDGGLSYNVPISAFDAQDLKTISTDGKEALGVYAAVDVGTKADDGFALYGRGGLTVSIGDSFGMRVSLKVWLVTSDHEGVPTGEACVQYAGGSFDAGATAHFETPGGLLVVDAPKFGGDVCTQSAIHAHFGSGDWYVNVGTKSAPISLYLLWTNSQGYLMMNDDGVVAYASVSVDKSWGFESSICDGSVGFASYLGAEGLVKAKPFYIQASVSGGVKLKAEACGIGTSLDTSVHFKGGAPPLKLCGGINVYVDLWPDDIDFTINRCLF